MWSVARLLVAIGCGSALTVTLASTAFACDSSLEGQPANLQPGGELGVYLWHDDQGLHLRTTGPGGRHVFNVRLETGGEFQDVRLFQPEGEDGVVVHTGGHAIDLHLETFDQVDGLDFRIANGRRLLVAVERDGSASPTADIFQGASGAHPASNPFFGVCTDRLDGQPANLRPGGDPGFYLWRDDSGFHARISGPVGERHLYTARLETGGEIHDVRLARAERGDGFDLQPGGHVLELRFGNAGLLDGVDFTVTGQALTVTVFRDGAPLPTELIYLGANAEHPAHNPFLEVWEI